MENTYTHKTHTPEFINKQMDKKGLNKLLAQIYLEYGGAKTADLADTLKNLGYKMATKSGVTISISDLSVPDTKKALLEESPPFSILKPTTDMVSAISGIFSRRALTSFATS